MAKEQDPRLLGRQTKKRRARKLRCTQFPQGQKQSLKIAMWAIFFAHQTVSVADRLYIPLTYRSTLRQTIGITEL